MASDKTKDTAKTEQGNLPAVAAKDQTLITYDDLMSYINTAREEAQTDPAAIERRIFEDMLAAESADDLFSPQTVVSSKDLFDVPMVITGVDFLRSDYGEGDGIYAIITADVQGKRTKVSCGARTPMMQLLIAREKGWLPLTLKFQRSLKATEAGFYPTNLIPAVVEDPF